MKCISFLFLLLSFSLCRGRKAREGRTIPTVHDSARPPSFFFFSSGETRLSAAGSGLLGLARRCVSWLVIPFVYNRYTKFVAQCQVIPRLAACRIVSAALAVPAAATDQLHDKQSATTSLLCTAVQEFLPYLNALPLDKAPKNKDMDIVWQGNIAISSSDDASLVSKMNGWYQPRFLNKKEGSKEACLTLRIENGVVKQIALVNGELTHAMQSGTTDGLSLLTALLSQHVQQSRSTNGIRVVANVDEKLAWQKALRNIMLGMKTQVFRQGGCDPGEFIFAYREAVGAEEQSTMVAQRKGFASFQLTKASCFVVEKENTADNDQRSCYLEDYARLFGLVPVKTHNRGYLVESSRGSSTDLWRIQWASSSVRLGWRILGWTMEIKAVTALLQKNPWPILRLGDVLLMNRPDQGWLVWCRPA